MTVFGPAADWQLSGVKADIAVVRDRPLQAAIVDQHTPFG